MASSVAAILLDAVMPAIKVFRASLGWLSDLLLHCPAMQESGFRCPALDCCSQSLGTCGMSIKAHCCDTNNSLHTYVLSTLHNGATKHFTNEKLRFKARGVGLLNLIGFNGT